MKQPSTRSAPALQRTRQYWRTSHHRRAWLGLIVFACTFAAAWVGGGGGGGGGGWLLLAQGSKPSQAQPPQEEEITTPLPVKPPLREDDETAKPQPGPVLAAVDLLAESRRTKHPTLSKFYRDLATPYDELKLRHVPVQKILPVARGLERCKKKHPTRSCHWCCWKPTRKIPTRCLWNWSSPISTGSRTTRRSSAGNARHC
jgi:hypothetical protein